MTLREGIEQSYLAKGLTGEQIDELTKITEELSFEDCAEVLRQHERGSDMFVVLDGRVCITAATGDLITRLKPGGVFGEVSLLDQRPRSATVTAEGPTRVGIIRAEALTELFRSFPALGVVVLTNVGRLLCERLRSANQQIEALLVAF